MGYLDQVTSTIVEEVLRGIGVLPAPEPTLPPADDHSAEAQSSASRPSQKSSTGNFPLATSGAVE